MASGYFPFDFNTKFSDQPEKDLREIQKRLEKWIAENLGGMDSYSDSSCLVPEDAMLDGGYHQNILLAERLLSECFYGEK